MMLLNRIIRRLRFGSDSGQTMVETALCATIFLLFMFGTISFGYLYYTKVTLQNAVRQAGRYAVTGNCSSGNCFDNGQGSGDRLNTIIQTVKQYSFNLNPTVNVQCIGTCNGAYGSGTENAGGPGDTVMISAQYTYTPVFIMKWFPSGGYTFTVSSTFQNELFPPPSN
jgi:Flp pilus assembly protein TadG